MGVVCILLGLLAAGAAVDLAVGTGSAGDPTNISALGAAFSLSPARLVAVAALLGALSVLLGILGIGFLRGSWGRRRSWKRRVEELEAENAALRARAHLAAVVRPPRAALPPEEPPDLIVLEEAGPQREEAHAEPGG